MIEGIVIHVAYCQDGSSVRCQTTKHTLIVTRVMAVGTYFVLWPRILANRKHYHTSPPSPLSAWTDLVWAQWYVPSSLRCTSRGRPNAQSCRMKAMMSRITWKANILVQHIIFLIFVLLCECAAIATISVQWVKAVNRRKDTIIATFKKHNCIFAFVLLTYFDLWHTFRLGTVTFSFVEENFEDGWYYTDTVHQNQAVQCAKVHEASEHQ